MRFAHALVALLAVSAPVAFAAPRCKIVIDMPKPKDGGGFACGEKIDVRIRVLCDGKAVATNAWVALDNWGPGVVRKAAVEKIPAEGLLVRGVTLDRPGCLRCEVRIRERHALASVPFEPQAIRSGSPLPPDFMDWWRGEIARLDATVPAEVELTPWATAATNRFDCWRVRCPTAGGKSVHGLLTVPKDRSKGPFPVHVSVPGAGIGEPYDQSKIGYAHWPDNGRVRLTIFAHCAQIDIPEVRREYAERMLKEHREKYGLKGNYVVAGISESREAYHYYPIILGANRLVNWLVRQPYSDPRDVIYSGTSQGGGMGLVLSALNPSFTRVFLNVPAMCDTMGSLQGRQSGWPQPVERQVPGNRAAAARNAPYFDGANFARFIKCPIRIGCGWADTICPSPGTMAVYNNIPAADKAIVGVPHAGHGVVIPRCNAWLYGSRHVPPFDRETTHVIASTPDP